MPLYEYECETCGKRFERIQKFSDPPVAECPTCGGPVKKLVSSPAIQFKGSGWYITDYARKSSSGKDGAPAGSKGASEAKEGAKDSTTKDSGKDAGTSSSDSSTSPPAKTPSGSGGS